MTKRTAIYGRVSTDEQAGKDKLSLPRQIAKGEAYADLHDLEVVDVYREDFTGTKPMQERPEGPRLMPAVRAGDIEIVVFWKLDRVGRSALVILNAFGDIEDAGAALVLVEEGIDTSTAVGRAFRTILAAFAELERDSILTRTGIARYGLSQAGVFSGSPIPFGFFLSEDRRTFLINEDEASTVRRAYELRLEGLSMVEVAKRLTAEGHRTQARNYTDKTRGEVTRERRPWRTSRTTKLIASEWYKGESYTLPVRIDPLDQNSLKDFSWPMPPLVDTPDWAKANERRARLPKNAGQRRNIYALRKRIYHDHDHDHGDGDLVSMYGSTRTSSWKGTTKREREYLCNEGRTNTGTGAPPSCPGFGFVQREKVTTRVKADRVEALCIHYMLGLIQHPERLSALRDDADERPLRA